jgi:protein OS-9
VLIKRQFHCNPQSADKITLIKETSTCAYLMVIQTPRLCNDVAFLPPQKDRPNAINCSPILTEDQVEDYERDIRALRSAEKDARIWEANAEASAAMGDNDAFGVSAIQVVGDILVGSHEIVPEGVKLEKSAIVGGGKETYVDTVASSDGRVLSDEELKKLGLGDARAVEKLKKELEKIAGGKDWKLDVIDTPRGREYRGIIGEDEEEEEKKAQEPRKESKKGKGEKETKEKDKDKENQGSQEEYYKDEL